MSHAANLAAILAAHDARNDPKHLRNTCRPPGTLSKACPRCEGHNRMAQSSHERAEDLRGGMRVIQTLPPISRSQARRFALMNGEDIPTFDGKE